MDAVKVGTHGELFALPSRLANFERGAGRLVLGHQVHVHYCAFALSKLIRQQIFLKSANAISKKSRVKAQK